MKTNLAKIPDIAKMVLADGKEYELAPVDLNMLVKVEDEFNCPFVEALSGNRIKPIRFFLYLRLKENYPELTLETVGKLANATVLENTTQILEV